MKLQFGIIGLDQSGKTTIFNTLCSAKASVGDYSSSKTANIAVLKVPDERVDRLAGIYNSRKKTYAEIDFIDIGGISSHKSADKNAVAGLLKEGSYVSQIRMSQALLIVIRCFNDPNIPHPMDTVNPKRDIDQIETEFMLIDMVQIEKRTESISRMLKVRPTDQLKTEAALMAKLQEHLESGKPLRDLELTKDEAKVAGGFKFLSQKPVLYLLNIGEEQIGKETDLKKEILPDAGSKIGAAALCGKVEMEISALEEEEREVFLEEMGITEPALAKVLAKSYDLLGLITFLTIGEEESRAWPVRDGSTALDAAGGIHTDIAKGFIKAETIHYDDLVNFDSWGAARSGGKLRLEGKQYVIKDGDVILFKFNV